MMYFYLSTWGILIAKNWGKLISSYRESNLLKFVIEDGIIGHIQTMSPRFTNPRIRTLQNILTDMGYINPQGKATDLGRELLKEIS